MDTRAYLSHLVLLHRLCYQGSSGTELRFLKSVNCLGKKSQCGVWKLSLLHLQEGGPVSKVESQLRLGGSHREEADSHPEQRDHHVFRIQKEFFVVQKKLT